MLEHLDSLGSHPFNSEITLSLRPPPPRYSSPWDVSKATDYFKTSAPLLELSLKLLASAQRPQTFSASHQNFRKESQNSISFVVTALLKTSKAMEVC